MARCGMGQVGARRAWGIDGCAGISESGADWICMGWTSGDVGGGIWSDRRAGVSDGLSGRVGELADAALLAVADSGIHEDRTVASAAGPNCRVAHVVRVFGVVSGGLGL